MFLPFGMNLFCGSWQEALEVKHHRSQWLNPESVSGARSILVLYAATSPILTEKWFSPRPGFKRRGESGSPSCSCRVSGPWRFGARKCHFHQWVHGQWKLETASGRGLALLLVIRIKSGPCWVLMCCIRSKAMLTRAMHWETCSPLRRFCRSTSHGSGLEPQEIKAKLLEAPPLHLRVNT